MNTASAGGPATSQRREPVATLSDDCTNKANEKMRMKVFISSVISGMQDHRAAVREAAESLGHAVIAAEDFSASPNSSQQVCLAGIRDADIVVLLLGARYGSPQASGLSPTHEEYREARGTKPVLVFVQTRITAEPDQDKFIAEVSTWEGGGFRQTFDTPASLRRVVVRALHDWELSQQAGAVNEDELKAHAVALIPRQVAYAAGSPVLSVAVASAPTRQILRPDALDDAELHRDLQQQALFGQRPIFDSRQGVQVSVAGVTLTIQQPNAELISTNKAASGSAFPLATLAGGDRSERASRRSSRRTSAIASPALSTTPAGCSTALTPRIGSAT
jgi:hypothetical protein